MTKSNRRTNRPRHHRSTATPEPAPELRSRAEVQEARRKRARKTEGPSLEALAGAAVAGPFGYLAVEGIMNDNRHPLHWILAIVAGVVGYGIGAGVYRWKQSH